MLKPVMCERRISARTGRYSVDMQTINSILSKNEFKVSFGSIKTILWHNHWWQRVPVAQVQGLHANGAAIAMEDTPLWAYTT